MLLLRFLDWMAGSTDLDTDVVLLHGGSMEQEFDRFDARVIGGADSRLWMIQRGLTNLNFSTAANALAFARQAPTMWANRRAPLVLLNSLGSLPAVRFMPGGATGKIVLYVHELDDSFDRTLGAPAWKLLSPRVDHFITCGSLVTEMLVERKGIDRSRITEHPGFVEPPPVAQVQPDELRKALDIPADAFVVGACGKPEWRKGPEVFVRMARTLLDRRPDIDPHFVWMGGPMDESPGFKMIHDVHNAGLTERFHFTGEVDNPTDVLDMLDVFALTSREDPFPLVMLEAASVGTPVVSFANGGAVQFAEATADAPLAEIVPYLDVDAMANSIICLAESPDARAALGDRGRRHVLQNHVTAVSAPELLRTLTRVQPSLARKWNVPDALAPGAE